LKSKRKYFMDFDQAISKLERDHSHLKRMAKSKAAEKERLQRNAESRRKIVEKQLALEEKRMQKLKYVRKCKEECDTSLLLESKRWLLEPTSIHGDGDKIALPESLLQQIIMDGSAGGNDVEVLQVTFSKNDPLIFRIGIVNPEYDPTKHFPLSPGMRSLMNNYRPEDEVDEDAMVIDGNNDRKGQGMKDEEEDDRDKLKREAYLDELCCKYLAFTHCTVVEFTQEEGRVGLPQAISTALLTGQKVTTLSQQRHSTSLSDVQQKLQDPHGLNYIVPSTRTMEPPSKGEKAPSTGATQFHKGQYVVYTKEQIIVKISNVYLDEELVPYYDIQTLDGFREIQTTDNYLELFRNSTAETDDAGSSIGGAVTESTAGHAAYGAFDIPNVKVELTLVRPRAIPKGTGCTLVPSLESASEFSRLPNIKTALEQSLIRTRATLSLNDIVYCWYRGTKFDLRVRNVTPTTWGVVSCINTDMEVNIDYHDVISPTDGDQSQLQDPSTSTRDIMPSPSLDSGTSMLQKRNLDYTSILPPEPDAAVEEGNVCTIMIRAGAGITDNQPQPQQRRFDRNTATLRDIHVFAAHVCNLSESEMDSHFQLVSRFPRIVFHNSPSILLIDSGLQSGQNLLLVERKRP
jgi:hypothetical protein